jgi:hypothetical protein
MDYNDIIFRLCYALYPFFAAWLVYDLRRSWDERKARKAQEAGQ